MSFAAYPTDTNVTDFLTGQGVVSAATGTVGLAQYAAAARDEFERRTGRQFLGDAANTVRIFDPPANDLLILGVELWSLNTVQWQPQGGSAETLTSGTDYLALSPNVTVVPEPLNEPVWALRFLTRRWGWPLSPSERHSIRVSAKWGHGENLPDDVWLAMVQRAAQLAAPTASGASSWRFTFEDAVRRWRLL